MLLRWDLLIYVRYVIVRFVAVCHFALSVCVSGVPFYVFSTTHCSLLRLTVRSGLDVPTFATRRLHAFHHARAAEGGTVGEKCLGILPKCRSPRYI